MKLLHRNISENVIRASTSSRAGKKGSKQKKPQEEEKIQTRVLDWETDIISDLNPNGFDVVIASDCIYNPSLIKPFVQTCVDACSLRSSQFTSHTSSLPPSQTPNNETENKRSTVCIVAQQLRSPDVFEEWLKEFGTSFKVWRLQDEEVGRDLGEGSGFVVHVGVLKVEVDGGGGGQG